MSLNGQFAACNCAHSVFPRLIISCSPSSNWCVFILLIFFKLYQRCRPHASNRWRTNDGTHDREIHVANIRRYSTCRCKPNYRVVRQAQGKLMKSEEARLDALQKHSDCAYAEVYDGSELLLGPTLLVRLWRDKRSYMNRDQPRAIEIYPAERSEPEK